MAQAREIDGLSADLPFAEAGALVVETRMAELLEHSTGVLDVEQISGVHDMRVGTRRLRAALEVFAQCFPKTPHKAVLKEVKAIADALGERRDRDVAIRALAGFADSIAAPDRPGINSLIELYREEQQAANQALVPFVEPKRLDALSAAVLELTTRAHELVEPDPDRGDSEPPS